MQTLVGSLKGYGKKSTDKLEVPPQVVDQGLHVDQL